jgi:hypothetical protein
MNSQSDNESPNNRLGMNSQSHNESRLKPTTFL